MSSRSNPTCFGYTSRVNLYTSPAFIPVPACPHPPPQPIPLYYPVNPCGQTYPTPGYYPPYPPPSCPPPCPPSYPPCPPIYPISQ